MKHPWGLTGQQFLIIYIAGIIVSLLIPMIISRVLGLLPGPQGTGRMIDDYEVAYLNGGPARVAEVAIVELSSRGALRVSSAGKVRVADPGAAWTGSQAAQRYGLRPENFPFEIRTSRALQRIRKVARLTLIREELQAEGLLLSPARMVAFRVATAVVVAGLLGTGIARMAEGISNHRPTSELGFLLVLTAIVSAVRMRVLFSGSQPTARGTAFLSRASKQGAPELPPDPAMNLAGQGALLAVALAGFSAVTDVGLRTALSAGRPSSSGGGDGCGGDGGGGDGGGGCGG